jgi:hypothetical protein
MVRLRPWEQLFVDGETPPIYHQGVEFAAHKSLSDWAKTGLDRIKFEPVF